MDKEGTRVNSISFEVKTIKEIYISLKGGKWERDLQF